MLLKIGELAKRTALTVRTLHHYDAIGLLSPSARSDAGYRLYNQNDIARLHRIQAMRRFGMSLSDIGATLSRPDLPLAAVVERQIAMLTRQIDQASVLRGWLSRLHGQLAGGSPVLCAKLNAMHAQEPSVQARTGITPALMAFVMAALQENQFALYANYLDEGELAFMRANMGKRSADWPPLIARVRAAMEAGQAPESTEAQGLAGEWYALFRSFAGDNPVTQKNIGEAMENEPELANQGWVDGAMRACMRAAMSSMQPCQMA